MHTHRSFFILCLLVIFSLTTACTTEKERNKRDPDTSIIDEEDTNIPEDIENDIEEEEEEDTNTPEDIEEDIEEDVEEDVEEDILEPDVEEPVDLFPPCTVTQSLDEIIVECADGTTATFDAELASDTSEQCELVTHDDAPDAILCPTIDNTQSTTRSGFTLTSPLDIGYIAYATAINGHLTIDAPGLISFTFPGLQRIGLHLQIDNQASLKTFSFPALTTIGRYLQLHNNAELTTLSGLEALTSIGQYLDIRSNPKLTNLSGFSALTSINGSLDIHQNPELTSLTGLNSVTSIAGNLAIINNNNLTNLNGLNALEQITGYMHLTNNAQLNSLNGLDSLTSLGRFLHINSNPELCQSTILAWFEAFQAATGWDEPTDFGENKACIN